MSLNRQEQHIKRWEEYLVSRAATLVNTSSFQQKTTRHAKRQNLAHTREKGWLTETVPEEAQTLY